MRFNILLILIFSFTLAFPQKYDKNYFRPPVNIPMRLAGNFGEIRTNHFHSGIDIKVPFEGIPVYAAADGFISRIRKSADGYGNSLYIDHLCGMRTLYGHMQKFRKDIETYITNLQYEQGQFEITDYPDSSKFKVKKGDLIGYAGNSGRSYGPHVHFEIRKSEKDIPVNPEFFNLKITDKIKPRVFAVEAVPLKKNASINNKYEKQIFKPYYKNGKYYIPGIIRTKGDFGIAFNADDYLNFVKNTQGICKVKMLIDDTLYFEYELKEISFNDTRYVNSFIDYAEKQKTKKNFSKLWKDPGNKLNIYKTCKNNGIINFDDKKIHPVKIEMTDCFNNTTALFMRISGSKPDFEIPEKNKNDFFSYNNDNYFIKPDFRAVIKKGSLYTDIEKKYKKTESKDFFSDIHQLNSNLIPVHKNINYAIKPENLPKRLISKALVVNIGKNGKIYPAGGVYVNGFIAGKCKCFGKFAVTADTIPPEINYKPANPENNYTDKKNITFKITDNLSGIKKYSVKIDDNPIIFSYDKKNNRISYNFDNHIHYGKKHKLTLEVSDKKNNKSVLQFSFFK